MTQMQTTWAEMWKYIAPNGVWLTEDTHTCYWPEYGGGLGAAGSFCELSKSIADFINAAYWRPAAGDNHQIRGLHYYDSMIFVEKMNPGHEPQRVASVAGSDWIPAA